MAKWVHRSRGTMIAAGIVGLALLPVLGWLSNPPPHRGDVRWPGRDWAGLVNFVCLVLVLGLFFLAVPFAAVLTYQTARYGPDDLVKRTYAAPARAARAP